MSEYKPGDTVLYGGDTPCTFEYGPYRSNPNGKEYALVKFENGYCDTVSLESLHSIPDWEYLALGPYIYVWGELEPVGVKTEYRRLKNDHTTIEHLTPEEVEALRHECN